MIKGGISGGLIFSIKKKTRQIKNTPENRERRREIQWLDETLDEVGHKISVLGKSKKDQNELERCRKQCEQLRREKKDLENRLDRE